MPRKKKNKTITFVIEDDETKINWFLLQWYKFVWWIFITTFKVR